jgi:hypothetical protein
MNLDRPRNVSVEVELPPQFLADVLTTAVEGGINYWCVADSVDRARTGDLTGLDDLSVVRVVRPVDREDAANGASIVNRWGDFDLDTVHLGIDRIVAGRIEIAPSIRAAVVTAVLGYGDGPDAGDIDADLADVIVQAGALNGVVYG